MYSTFKEPSSKLGIFLTSVKYVLTTRPVLVYLYMYIQVPSFTLTRLVAIRRNILEFLLCSPFAHHVKHIFLTHRRERRTLKSDNCVFVLIYTRDEGISLFPYITIRLVVQRIGILQERIMSAWVPNSVHGVCMCAQSEQRIDKKKTTTIKLLSTARRLPWSTSGRAPRVTCSDEPCQSSTSCLSDPLL